MDVHTHDARGLRPFPGGRTIMWSLESPIAGNWEGGGVDVKNK